MTAHLDQLASLAASLPPGAVLAHVVTPELLPAGLPGFVKRKPGPRRAWAKIGDELWRSVNSVEVSRATEMCQWPDGWLVVEWPGADPGWGEDTYRIVTDSIVWEQGYGLRGRHEVMGVVG